MNPPGVKKISPQLLKRFSEGCYVASTVYFHAPAWVRWMNWAKLECLWTMAPKEENLRVLDFACGNGVMLPTWERNFAQTVGLDLHVTAADRVRRHFRLGRVQLTRASGTSLPFSPGSFDLIFASSALEHFRDLNPALKEIRRVLRKGGQMVFLCPNENEFYGWGRRLAGYKKPPDHYRSADQVFQIVKSFFELTEMSQFPRWVPPFFCLYKMGRAVKV